MDIYSLARKQRPTHPTRAQIDSENSQVHPQMPPPRGSNGFEQQRKQSREYLLRKNQPQQKQSTSPTVPPVLTIHDISQKHSQLPPQYRQAVLEQQQREHQLQASKHQLTSTSRPPHRNHPDSPSSSTICTNICSLWRTTPQQRAPSTSSPQSEKEKKSTAGSGPSRAHWKPDSSTQICTWPGCTREFSLFDRRHHCRKCGDIYCSAHCSKSVPLDRSLKFSPSEGVSCRACNACFEAYEQWQQNLTCTTRGTYHHVKDSFGLASSFGNTGSCVSDRHRPLPPSGQAYGGVNKNLGSIPDGKDALGRDGE
ncbi:MAG: hypothetical protein BYD32DRAFT_143550 [Podila humilis]|nr:MAG: hypothetical protein BYD32DRAFT_143550 [Podila humilis]